MIEEYENWEDSIRVTFIELANLYMKQHSDPIEFVIEFAWANGCDLSVINSAKDQIKKLKEKQKEWVIETFKANTFAIEQTNEYLKISQQMQDLKDSLASPVAWAKINSSGDLYDLNLQNNPYNNQNEVVALYRMNK